MGEAHDSLASASSCPGGPAPGPATVTVGSRPLGLAAIQAVAFGRAGVRLDPDPAFRARIEASRALLQAALDRGEPVYGVTTGFGRACGNRVDPQQTTRLGDNLIRYHGCGCGVALGIPAVRAALLCRLLCFSRGYSAVSWALLEQLAAFLNAGITPVVPCQGSVGASGDLTPMSYVAAALAGEREVFHAGKRVPAAAALSAAGLAPHRFAAKEAIALLNGTPIMTGIAVVVLARARHVLDAALGATALALHGLAGHAHHFHPALFEAKPHPGSRAAAARLRYLLANGPAAAAAPPLEADAAGTLQDPYSLRCAPQVLGVLADALSWIEPWVECEANSANDNPLLDPASGQVLMGGNFYGGHIGFAMDALKAALASAADLADRQVALLVDPRFSRGLPADLVADGDDPHHLCHGFKALQITASALAAEALHGTLPATVFSRSTESHNQDKVSMGTIAARDALRVAELAARTVAAGLLVAAQAAELRGGLASRPRLVPLLAAVRARSPRLVADRPLDGDLASLAAAILEGTLAAAVNGGPA